VLKKILLIGALSSLSLVSVHADTNISNYNAFEKTDMFKHFERLQKEMDRVFEDFNKDMFKGFNPNLTHGLNFSPNTDLEDKGDSYELKMDIPGMDDQDIKIEIKDNYLNVIAKSEVKKEKKEGKMIQQERHVGMVQRGMTLPKDADVDKYSSNYAQGVLTITIPKKK